jgi:GAF domain
MTSRGLVTDRDRWAEELTRAEIRQPQRICELCVQELDITGAGISMVTTSGNRGVVCATDDIAARIEDLQVTLGEGPCIDAVHRGAPVLIGDLNEPQDIAVHRWPAFLEGAASVGVRGVFAFPLRIGAISVGAMDLYRDRPGELLDDELSAALMAADTAALTMLNLATGHSESGDGGAFADDAGSRAMYQMQVHQATGMVTVQAGVNVADAYLMLRARAFADGRPLAELATDVVERRVRFGAEE